MIAARGGKVVMALDTSTTVFTCSTGSTLSGVAINGLVFDRLGLNSTGGQLAARLGQRNYFNVAEPFLFGWSAGSTVANRQYAVDIKLQHGDSSGGGDMADYSTQDQPTQRVFGNTVAFSTDTAGWSTGLVSVTNNPCDYELTGAKRYIRPVGTVTKTGFTTSTASGTADLMTVMLGLDLREFVFSIPAADTTSSSTST